MTPDINDCDYLVFLDMGWWCFQYIVKSADETQKKDISSYPNKKPWKWFSKFFVLKIFALKIFTFPVFVSIEGTLLIVIKDIALEASARTLKKEAQWISKFTLWSSKQWTVFRSWIPSTLIKCHNSVHFLTFREEKERLQDYFRWIDFTHSNTE